MLPNKRILFAADLTDDAPARLAFAMGIAHRLGAELHVFHADVLHTAGHEGRKPRNRDAAVVELQRVVDQACTMRGEARSVLSELVVERNLTAAPAILDHAREANVGLIILGTHGRRGLQRLILGSVAEEVLRGSDRPVLTLHVPFSKEAALQDVRSILVPVDFSDLSRRAIVEARHLAEKFGARLHLLHVVEETLHPAFYGINVQSVYDVDPNIESKVIDQMETIVEGLNLRGIDVSCHAGPGKAARKIVEFSDSHDIGLVVIASHGLTGLDHFIMGSTTERVVRAARCPVYLVKSRDSEVAPATDMDAARSDVSESLAANH